MLKQRLDAIAYLTQPRNAEVLNSLQSCLKHIKNVAVSQSALFFGGGGGVRGGGEMEEGD